MVYKCHCLIFLQIKLFLNNVLDKDLIKSILEYEKRYMQHYDSLDKVNLESTMTF